MWEFRARQPLHTSMSRTLAWERLGNRFLSNVEGPTMRWSKEISHCHVRAAKCAGIIAIWPKNGSVVRPVVSVSTRNKQHLELFSCNGTQMGQINLDFGEVADVRIMSDETILVICESGITRHYIDYGLNFVQLHLPGSVIDSQIYGDGYIVRFAPSTSQDSDGNVTLGLVTHCRSAEPTCRVINSKVKSSNMVLWDIVPGNEESGRPSRNIFVDDQGRLHTYDMDLSDASHQVVTHNVPVGILKVSPDCELVAFSDGNRVMILTTDLHEVDYESNNVSNHSDVHWVGTDILALQKSENCAGEVEVLDLNLPSSGSNTAHIYFEDEHVALLPEIDGLRVLGTHNHSILMPVLRPTLETFKLGSIYPSAILFSCVDQIDAGSPRSEQTIKMLEPSKLASAVDTCISAALQELEPKLQKRLMRSAAFGKSMLPAYDSSRYLQTLSYLRIGNSLRNLGDKGFFITNTQITELGITTLINRLQLRRLWGEAISLAQLMALPVEPIYIEWACWVIQTEDSASEAELMSLVQAKLSKLHTYSRSKMALKALEQGRQELAQSLLEKEPVASDRVILLLEMDMVQQAVEQAIKSGNPFLVDYVLVVLTEQLSLPQMIRIIGGNMLAIDRQKQILLANSHVLPQHSSAQQHQQAENKVHDFLYQMDLRAQSVRLEFNDVLSERDILKKTRVLRALEKKFASLSKKSFPESKACSEWADLLALQRQLNDSYELDLTNKSAADTVLALLKIPQLTQAQRIRSKLGISDRQFMWLRIRALVDRREFEDLWELSQSRKPHIGYQSFFNVCLEAGNKDQAARYVHLISEASVEEKVKLYVKCENYDLARTLASRNPELLSLIP